MHHLVRQQIDECTEHSPEGGTVNRQPCQRLRIEAKQLSVPAGHGIARALRRHVFHVLGARKTPAHQRHHASIQKTIHNHDRIGIRTALTSTEIMNRMRHHRRNSRGDKPQSLRLRRKRRLLNSLASCNQRPIESFNTSTEESR